MSSPLALEINRAKHITDPKTVIFEAAEEVLAKVQPTGADLMVCIYERPKEIVAGKDHLGREVTLDVSATSRALEDKLQGRVGLVVAHGPKVNDHKDVFLDGHVPAVGTWVLVNGGDAVPFVGGFKPYTRMFRLVQANFVRAVLTDPDIVL